MQTKAGFFRGHSVPVNEKLSEIFLQLHISEKTGRGIPVISSEYGEGAFDFSDNDVTVTIPFNFINEVGDKVGDKTLNDSLQSWKDVHRQHNFHPQEKRLYRESRVEQVRLLENKLNVLNG